MAEDRFDPPGAQKSEKKRPKRYKLYDKIPLSLNVVNGVILGGIVLIVLLVVAGMFIR